MKPQPIKIRKGMLVLLAEEDFRAQRATVLEVDRKNKVLTFCIVEDDREPEDEDGLGETGFEDVYALTPAI